MGENTEASLLDQFVRLWRADAPPPDLMSFLRAHPEAPAMDRLGVLLADQKRRWKTARPFSAEEYFAHFPDAFEATEYKLAIVYGEFAARRDRGESPSENEMKFRFPELHSVHMGLAPPKREPAIPRDPDAPLDFADFTLVAEIGEGGMGRVYRATQSSSGRTVAIKILKEFGGSPLDTVSRFLREGYPAANLRHPNIVPVHGVGRLPDGGYFLMMDFIGGGNLATRISAGPISIKEMVRMMIDIADGIDHAHRSGVIHRDLKPSNILLDGSQRVLVTDFGIARWISGSAAAAYQADQLAGTPHYMAPEQADPRWGTIGQRTDVYGLGGILYSMLVCRPPYDGRTSRGVIQKVLSMYHRPAPPSQLRAGIPLPLQELCLKCLAKRPAGRFGSAKEVVVALRECPLT